jgi:hypothetical protein
MLIEEERRLLVAEQRKVWPGEFEVVQSMRMNCKVLRELRTEETDWVLYLKYFTFVEGFFRCAHFYGIVSIDLNLDG